MTKLELNIKNSYSWLEMEQIQIEAKNCILTFLKENELEIKITNSYIHNKKFDLILKTKEELKKEKKKKNTNTLELKDSYFIYFNFNKSFDIKKLNNIIRKKITPYLTEE